jgi:hypothetical protein
MRTFSPPIVVLLCCGLILLGGLAAGASTYQLSVPNSVETPDRVVTLEGDEYTVSAIGVVSPGESIEAAVPNAPEDADYSVYLYDHTRNIVDTDAMTGPGTATFDTDGYAAGSYLLVVNGPDGNYRTVHPVIIRSYEVSVDAPDRAEAGETIQLTVSVENVAGTTDDLESVQVVLSKNGDDRAMTATKESDGTYTVETTLSETGEYLVYANVRGPDETDDRKELLGATNANTIEIRDATPTPTATPTASSSSGGGNANSQPDDTATPTATMTPTATATATPTDGETATESPTPTETATATQTATSDEVVTPNTDATTQTSVPIHPAVPLVALLTFLLWRRP